MKMKKVRKTIIGPPGTGKTTWIIDKVYSLIERGVRSDRIGLVTFTKIAAKVLAKRANISSDYIGTMHSIAFRLAKMSRSQVVNDIFYKDFSNHVGIPITNRNVEDNDQIELGDEFLSIYQYYKATLADDPVRVYMDSYRPGSLASFKYFITMFESYKLDLGFIDFNDMLDMAFEKDKPELDILFIDEAQDLSPLQWSLIDYWATGIKQVFVVGDDDQAIFQWGGADSKGISKWKSLHDADQEVLGQSYRIPKKVHWPANALIGQVKDRIEKMELISLNRT